MLATHRVLGGRAGIAGGGAEDVDRFAALVQNILEQVAEQLHRHVLEGERRAVRQLLRVQPIFQLGQRRDLGSVAAVAGEAVDVGGVGLGDDGLEVGSRDVGDELRQDFERQVGVRELAPGAEFGARHLRIGFGQIKPAVRRQPAEEDVAESLGRGLAAGRDVAHGVGTWKAEKTGILPRRARETHGHDEAQHEPAQRAAGQKAGRHGGVSDESKAGGEEQQAAPAPADR